jgi:hypothetical protein
MVYDLRVVHGRAINFVYKKKMLNYVMLTCSRLEFENIRHVGSYV